MEAFVTRKRTEALRRTDRVIGQRVRSYRRLRGLSQTALGGAIGVSYQQVQKYETGASGISAARLLLISRLLRIRVGSLLPGCPDDGNVAEETRWEHTLAAGRSFLLSPP